MGVQAATLARLRRDPCSRPTHDPSVTRSACRSRWGTMEQRLFSLYDNRMVTDEQIQQWADEAEAGYDVDQLKQRGRGRPGRGAEPMQVVAVRLTADELASLDAAAAKGEMSRSEAIRAALADLGT